MDWDSIDWANMDQVKSAVGTLHGEMQRVIAQNTDMTIAMTQLQGENERLGIEIQRLNEERKPAHPLKRNNDGDGSGSHKVVNDRDLSGPADQLQVILRIPPTPRVLATIRLPLLTLR